MEPQTTERLTQLNSGQLLHELEYLRSKAISLGSQWAEANKRFKDLKEMMPSILATIQTTWIEQSKWKLNEARVLALASEEYKEKLKEMSEAERDADLLYVEYRGYMASIEALTSISYVRNNEIKMETGLSARFQR